MNIGERRIWESSNLLLLIPVVIGLVMLLRWLQGRAVFTERDWLLFGHPREKVFTLRLWLSVRRPALGRGANWVRTRALRFALRD
jgi:hypothetical protein